MTFTYLLVGFLLAGATDSKIVPPDSNSVLTKSVPREDFVTLARQAVSVVRVKEASRRIDTHTLVVVVELEVVEQIIGAPVEHLEVAASIWDVVAPQPLRREGATFLLMVNHGGEILHVHSNGVPFVYGAGIVPIVNDAIPDDYADRYDELLILRPVTLAIIRQQLSRSAVVK